MRYVVMFNRNNRFMADHAVFSEFYVARSKFGYDPVTLKQFQRTEEQQKAFIEENRLMQLDRNTTDDLQQARIFHNEQAANLAASRSGMKRDQHFSIIPIEISVKA